MTRNWLHIGAKIDVVQLELFIVRVILLDFFRRTSDIIGGCSNFSSDNHRDASGSTRYRC